MSKTTQSVALSTAVSAAIGALVLSNKDGVETRYKIAGFDDAHVGSMKDGSKASYVVLKGEADEAIVVNMHPSHASRLLKLGVDSGYSLIKTEAAAETPATGEAEGTAEVTEKPAKKVKKAAGAKKAAAPKKAKAPAKVRTPRTDSKKAKAIALVTAEWQVEGWSRKAILEKMMADLGISQACANTYYQNINKGTWSAAEEVAEETADSTTADASTDAGSETPAADATE